VHPQVTTVLLLSWARNVKAKSNIKQTNKAFSAGPFLKGKTKQVEARRSRKEANVIMQRAICAPSVTPIRCYANKIRIALEV